MSIFPIPFIEDLIPSGSEDQSHDASGDESSDYSDSVMLSGISTDSTTDLTMVDPPSTMEAPDSPTPSLGDHGAAIMPPGLFIEIYREQLARNDEDDASDATSAMSEFGGTIVSSAPSGAQIDAPPLETSWAMTSTPPRPIHRENASISTTESMYRELASLEEDLVHVHEVQDDQSVDSSHLSLRPSMMDSSVVRSTWSLPSATERPNATSHERTTFVNVGDRLALQPIREDESEWFERFTDQDWLNFRRDAALPPPPSPPPLPAAAPIPFEAFGRKRALSEQLKNPTPSIDHLQLDHDLDLFRADRFLTVGSTVVAYVAAWEPYNLRDLLSVGHVSRVGYVLYRSCHTPPEANMYVPGTPFAPVHRLRYGLSRIFGPFRAACL